LQCSIEHIIHNNKNVWRNFLQPAFKLRKGGEQIYASKEEESSQEESSSKEAQESSSKEAQSFQEAQSCQEEIVHSVNYKTP